VMYWLGAPADMALSAVRVPRPCGAPPLPTGAERHAVLRLPAGLVRTSPREQTNCQNNLMNF